MSDRAAGSQCPFPGLRCQFIKTHWCNWTQQRGQAELFDHHNLVFCIWKRLSLGTSPGLMLRSAPLEREFQPHQVAQSTLAVFSNSRSTDKDFHLPRDLMDRSSGQTKERKICLWLGLSHFRPVRIVRSLIKAKSIWQLFPQNFLMTYFH